MGSDLIHDRGRGPEILGTRITVYDLLPYFFDPEATEEYIGKVYDLTSEQVAAARAFVFANADTVLARHLEIEARNAEGNPPEVIERAKRTHQRLLSFKEWLVRRQTEDRQALASASKSEAEVTRSDRLPTFREWLSQQDSHASRGS